MLICEIEQKIFELIKKNIANEKMDILANLTDLGINSITFVKILIAIENEYDFEFDDDDLNFENFKTVSTLAKYVEDRLQKP
ncbi:phosphopantetheine-binding protein [Ruminiclostridium cellobioparum]|jgi:acyl carrier protein|uniref:phosphopantetheine-binding protein n=1 Tax=Ruminiclostridium cellobioparum TaxID=29355 RepID=UPI00054E1F44|nr:phosphopantetheine-binding protein [Ruminiclostridium cellobioparum]